MRVGPTAPSGPRSVRSLHSLRMSPSLLISLAAATLCALAPAAQQGPMPVSIEAVASTVSDDGRFTLRLSCTPEEVIKVPYGLPLR